MVCKYTQATLDSSTPIYNFLKNTFLVVSIVYALWKWKAKIDRPIKNRLNCRFQLNFCLSILV